MLSPRSRVLIFGCVFLGVAASAAYVQAYLNREPLPLRIKQVDVVATAATPPALSVSGTHLDHPLQALIIPNPTLGEGDPRVLEPRTTLYQIDTDGRLAVASARGGRLITIDVGEGGAPRMLGSVETRSSQEKGEGITSLVLIGKHAIVGLRRDRGLMLIDLADPLHPRLVDQLKVEGSSIDLLAVGDTVIVPDIREGLWQVLIDGDRLRARRIPGIVRAWRLAADGNRLIAASLDGDLSFYKVSGTALHLVGHHKIGGEIRGVTLSGVSLHVCLADGSLREYDATAWPRLVLRGSLTLPGRPLKLVRGRNAQHLVCSLVGVGAAIVDVRHPGQPFVAGWLMSGSAITDLAVVGGRILFVNSDGLQIRSVSRLLLQDQLTVLFPLDQRREKIRLVGWQGEVFAYDSSQLVSVSAKRWAGKAMPPPDDDLLVVPAGNKVKLHLRSEAGVVNVAERAMSNPVKATLYRDGHLYVLFEEALEVYACSHDGVGEKLGRFDGLQLAQAFAWVDAEHLLVADRQAGVKLVSVIDPLRPHLVAEVPLPSFFKDAGRGPYDVLVTGQRAFVARGEFGVEVFDLSVPGKLQAVQLIDPPGSVQRLALTGNLLLAADRSRGLQIIDIGSRWCRPVGTIAIAAQVRDIVVTGKSLLINSVSGAVSQIPAPVSAQVQARDDGSLSLALPPGLPEGRYQLVLYDDRSLARADFMLY